jgi:hypothetical protein
MTNTKTVLVHLGSGMGNMLMATPMMEMLSIGGYKVDLCLQGETPNVESLFIRWPHIRSVSSQQESFIDQHYEIYIYGFEVTGDPILFSNFNEAIILHPMWDWHKSYGLHSEIELYSNLARCIVPDVSPVTQIRCVGSDRVFEDITEKTAVLVPGGGMQMIIRKWGGYGLLAEKLKDVAVVGLPADLDLSNRLIFPKWCKTVFGNTLNYQGRGWKVARNFSNRLDSEIKFPSHVKNYIGKLSLEDTAALISQAGYVIGNDCGVTHMAVALNKPVFPILGPTSRRKVFPAFLKNVSIISKQFDCQPCQEKPTVGVWKEDRSQCFCPYGIRCMEEITPNDVIKAVEVTLNETIT